MKEFHSMRTLVKNLHEQMKQFYIYYIGSHRGLKMETSEISTFLFLNIHHLF